MNWTKTFEQVRRIILDTRPSLHASRVTESSSLTGDLDLDVSHLDALFSRLRREVAEKGRPFAPWYIRASRAGHDTVASLVDFLVGLKVT